MSHTRRVARTSPDLIAEHLARLREVFPDPLLEGWTPDGVIAKVALKDVGFCLDEAIGPETARALNLGKDGVLICRDKALDDSRAANLALQCDLRVL